MLKIERMCNDNCNVMRNLTSFQNIYYDITGNNGVSLSMNKSHQSLTIMVLFIMNWLPKKYFPRQKVVYVKHFLKETETESYLKKRPEPFH